MGHLRSPPCSSSTVSLPGGKIVRGMSSSLILSYFGRHAILRVCSLLVFPSKNEPTTNTRSSISVLFATNLVGLAMVREMNVSVNYVSRRDPVA